VLSRVSRERRRWRRADAEAQRAAAAAAAAEKKKKEAAAAAAAKPKALRLEVWAEHERRMARFEVGGLMFFDQSR
jgi:hypothetical protein